MEAAFRDLPGPIYFSPSKANKAAAAGLGLLLHAI